MRILLTRTEKDNRKIEELILKSSWFVPSMFRIVSYPCVEIRRRELDRAKVEGLIVRGGFSAIVFTSRVAAEVFCELVGQNFNYSLPPIAAGGRETAKVLDSRGFDVEFVSEDGYGQSLAKKMVGSLKSGDRVLHIRGNLTTGHLQEGLKKGGVKVEQMEVYENVAPVLSPLQPDDNSIVVFASPSAVERFFSVNTGFSKLTDVKYVTIGRTTAQKIARKACGKVVVAIRPDNEGIVDAIGRILTRR